MDYKLEAVAAAKASKNKAALAVKMGVDRQVLSRWCKAEEDLKAEKDKRKKRLSGGGMKPAHVDVELQLFQWIVAQRAERLPVSESAIIQMGRQLAATQGEHLAGSRGWLYNFMQRYSLSLRRSTSVCQKIPADVALKVVRFILYLRLDIFRLLSF